MVRQGFAFLKAYAESAARTRMKDRYAIGTIVETDQGTFVVDPGDVCVGRSLAKHGRYDDSVLNTLLPLLSKEGDVCVVGAHIGALLVPLAKACRRAVAYEANPRSFKLLGINLKLNHVDHCEAFNLAAGEGAGSIAFLMNTANSGGSKRKPITSKFAYTYDQPDEIEVEMVSLDEHLGERSFDLIVMDIEGSEIFALRGMTGTLSRTRHLQVEYLPHHLDNVSGVDDAALAAAIEPYFDELRVQQCDDRPVGRSEFAAKLTELRQRGFCGDLLFSKR